MIFSVFQNNRFFLGILCPTKHGGNHASQWLRDLWSKSVSLILSYFLMFLSFSVFGDFFRFSKKSGFWVFLVYPPMASVLQSRLRDFLAYFQRLLLKMTEIITWVSPRNCQRFCTKLCFGHVCAWGQWLWQIWGGGEHCLKMSAQHLLRFGKEGVLKIFS